MTATPLFPIRRHRYGQFRVLLWIALLAINPVWAGVFDEGDTLMLQAAPGVIHFNPSDEHTD